MNPIDIKTRTFSREMRGYSCGEVDRFLESIGQEFEYIYMENLELREKTKGLEDVYKENLELKEKTKGLEEEISRYHKLENTLQQTLILAQQTAEDVKQSAQREAERILSEIENDRVNKLAETQNIIAGMKEEIEGLAERRDLLRSQLRSFLLAHLEKIQDEDQDDDQGGDQDEGSDMIAEASLGTCE